MNKYLHIVAFAVPYPVGYGGLYDLFYKIVALNKAGVHIHLHCFTDRNRQEPHLKLYCDSIEYYPRTRGLKGLSASMPYIVKSRSSKRLLQNILNDDYPILLEGIHSSGLLNEPELESRKIIMRLHNVEHVYYHRLFATSSSLLKRLYYLQESRVLKKYEARIAKRPSWTFAVSSRDETIYRQEFAVSNISALPVFIGRKHATTAEGTGYFCLYHGNLSIAENEKAVSWLLEKVFARLEIPLVIAGKNPAADLTRKISQFPNVQLVANPSLTQMEDLIRKAQCHVLPSFNTTGVKLKLINALFMGRHCIVNTAGVRGSGLEKICHVANSAADFRSAVLSLFPVPVRSLDISYRNIFLQSVFDEEKNTEELIRKLW